MKNVVAACQSYKFAETQKGDPFFSLTAIVKDPEDMLGRRATFMWFINESEYASVEDNLNQLANDLQLLGEEMPEDVADVVDVLAGLCERGVHLLFNTGQPRKNGRPPNLFIQCLAEDWPDEPQEGAGEAAERPQRGKGPQASNGDDTGDDAAADNDPDVAADAASDEQPAEDDAPWVPAKGDPYKFTPPGKKKAEIVEVVAVDKKKQTFDLKVKGAKPPKTYKGIKWFNDDGNPTVEAAD